MHFFLKYSKYFFRVFSIQRIPYYDFCKKFSAECLMTESQYAGRCLLTAHCSGKYLCVRYSRTTIGLYSPRFLPKFPPSYLLLRATIELYNNYNNCNIQVQLSIFSPICCPGPPPTPLHSVLISSPDQDQRSSSIRLLVLVEVCAPWPAQYRSVSNQV